MKKLLELLGFVLLAIGSASLVHHFTHWFGKWALVDRLPFFDGYELYASGALAVLGFAVLCVSDLVPAEAAGDGGADRAERRGGVRRPGTGGAADGAGPGAAADDRGAGHDRGADGDRAGAGDRAGDGGWRVGAAGPVGGVPAGGAPAGGATDHGVSVGEAPGRRG